MPATALLAQLQQWQQQAAHLHIRLPIIWQGDEETLLNYASQLVARQNTGKLYWVGDNAPENATQLSLKQHYQLLGSECDMLVINAYRGFPADLVAASAGCVKAGGMWLLLCPHFNQWHQQPNPAHKNLLPYPLDANYHQGHFVSFWLSQLLQQNVVVLSHNKVTQQLTWPALSQVPPVDAPCVTAEQQLAVEAILHVVRGHRKRPLVLTADRGRGKSAALGIAAASLVAQGKTLLITAASPHAVQTALQHFQQLTQVQHHKQLQFIPFDQLLGTDYTADLLLIDEAAAIPTPVLQKLLQRFSRVVFATTEHGYEGTGRGFQLRFQQYLTAQCPGWKKLHIQQPVRYQQDDPLEQLSFNCFLLRQHSLQLHYNANEATDFVVYQAKDWLGNTDKLQQVFNLLSLAHYQTQVKDLAALLDNPQLQVMTLEQAGQVLACALLSREGGIDTDLTTQIYHGERRLQGHLLAQSLAFHLARPELATTTLWRVMRITVQPGLQRQHLGSALLQRIIGEAQLHKVDYLGTSFGVTADLLLFWRKAGYQAIRLGHSVDSASSEYSILLLQAVHGDAATVNALASEFSSQLFTDLSLYPLLSATLALQLAEPTPTTPLTSTQHQQLQLFAQGKRPYELIRHVLLNWFNHSYHQLPLADAELLCALLWQHSDIATLSQKTAVNSKKAMINTLAKIVGQYCQLK